MHIYNLKLYKNAKTVCVVLVYVYNTIGVWMWKVSFLSWSCSLTEPEALWLGYAGWQASELQGSACLPLLHPTLVQGSPDGNSPDAGKADTLSTELSP